MILIVVLYILSRYAYYTILSIPYNTRLSLLTTIADALIIWFLFFVSYLLWLDKDVSRTPCDSIKTEENLALPIDLQLWDCGGTVYQFKDIHRR